MTADATSRLLASPSFVGRKSESARLLSKLAEAAAGSGGLVMLAGEPGIGKTRTAEEFAARARGDGATVLWGRCYDGEWSPPFGPFAEALAEYVRDADPGELRQDLGYGAPVVARLVPALREALPDIEDPAALQPDEERFRLLDAVSQFLIAVSQRAPLVLVLDDLHWADAGTIAMLRHVAHFVKQNRMLLVGAYRDVELDSEHRLSEALGQLRHETEYERLLLKGLDRGEVGELLTAITEQEASEALVEAISRETEGNPFFIRETLRHLVDTGALYRQDGVWTSGALRVEELGIAEGVRQVVAQRLSRLSESTNRLLAAGSAFDGAFRFDIAARVAQISEGDALAAVDQALAAQVLRAGSERDTLDFTHALFRHTLYAEMSPPRQARLHRQIAEAVESTYRERANEHSAELAYHYQRSATLPGAERGVDYAIAAADKAEAAYAHDDVARYLQMALDLMTEPDPRLPRLLGRLATALALSRKFDTAVATALRASDRIAAAQGFAAAAEYLGDTAELLFEVGFQPGAWQLGRKGLEFVGEQRDANWARLAAWNIHRQWAEDAEGLGVPIDSLEYREAADIVVDRPTERMRIFCPRSREHVLAVYGDEPRALMGWAGEFRRALSLLIPRAEESVPRGVIGAALYDWSSISYGSTALGDFQLARTAYEKARDLATRLPGASIHALQPLVALCALLLAVDPDDPDLMAMLKLVGKPSAEHNFALAALRSTVAGAYALAGNRTEALAWLGTLLPSIERAPGWAAYYPVLACTATMVLWVLACDDNAFLIEQNIREKVVAPDFRTAMMDGRLSLARLCALQGRHDEAAEWFAKAREVLDEQGARPLRAMVDYDEALMYARRGRRGDRNRAAPLVEAALAEFRELGMPGWVRRGQELQRGIEEKSMGVAVYPDGLTPREVDVLRLIARGRTNTEIASDLTLSVRTVGRHVTNLYNKIDVRNRAEAVDYAHRHDLT